MPTQTRRRNTVYGFPNPLDGIQQEPLIMDRAPTGFDSAELGTIWVDTSANDFRILTQIGANGGNVWTGTTGGSTTLTSLTVDPGDIDVTAGNINVAVGDLTLDAASTATLGILNAGNTTLSGTLDVIGNVTLGGDLDVTGDVTITGDFDITDTASISITSTNDAAGAVTIATNGGTSESIVIQSQQGTGAASVDISSVAGGVTLTAGLATADAINVVATAGGVDVDAAGQINIRSTQNAAQAIVIDSTAGGIEIVAAGAPGEDVSISSTAGSLNLSGGEAAANAILLQTGSVNGGITVNTGTAGLTVTAVAGDIIMNAGLGDIYISDDATAAVIEIGTGAADKGVTIGSTNTTSSVVIQAGTGGINLSSAGIFTLNAVATSTASPTATVVTNANVGAATFTGFTTAAAATQDFTITNSLVTATSQILCTVCNEGANDAQMNIRRITRGAGSFVVSVVNSGAAALNGNVTITFIVLN